AMTRGIGIDFGTTNSSIAVARDEKTVEALQFRTETGTTETYRSVLYFEPKTPGVSGPKAIERYLSVDEKGRLIQSLKSFLASRTFTGTNIYGRPFSVEDLITIMLRDLRIQAEEQIGTFEGPVVVGRPVRYSNADTEEDNQFALDRLKRALDKAGIGPVIFEYEPVAAAYFYESTLDHDELILISNAGTICHSSSRTIRFRCCAASSLSRLSLRRSPRSFTSFKMISGFTSIDQCSK